MYVVTSSSLQDEYRVEMNSRRVTELESVHNNVSLLSEMLDQYQLGQTSAEELELIKELHQSCERLRPSVFRLASETQDNESMLSEYRFGKYEHMVLHVIGYCFHICTDKLLNGNMFTWCIRTRLCSILILRIPLQFISECFWWRCILVNHNALTAKPCHRTVC